MVPFSTYSPHFATAPSFSKRLTRERAAFMPMCKLFTVALEKALGISADIWMNMQTQYDLDTANIAERDSQHENVTVTIPVRDRNLLKEIVRKFGWACVL